MHIGAGEFVAWRDGRRATRESFAIDTIFPLAPPLGDYRLYECAHPEPVMLGHSFPHLRSAVCWGGIHPPPLNGIIRGLAVGVRSGRLPMDEACRFLQSVSAGGAGSWRGWRHALAGMLRQLRDGHASVRDVLRYATAAMRRDSPPPLSGVGARARGLHRGHPCEVAARVHAHGAEDADAMAALTGLSAAAFFQLALEQPARPGVAFPETWVEPHRFYAGLNAYLRGGGASVEVEAATW